MQVLSRAGVLIEECLDARLFGMFNLKTSPNTDIEASINLSYRLCLAVF